MSWARKDHRPNVTDSTLGPVFRAIKQQEATSLTGASLRNSAHRRLGSVLQKENTIAILDHSLCVENNIEKHEFNVEAIALAHACVVRICITYDHNDGTLYDR